LTQFALADDLWQAYRTWAPVAAVSISVEEGFATLSWLVQRRLGGGDPIVGWKIARLTSGAQEPPFLFAAPVFASSLTSVPSRAGLMCETEFVAQMGRNRRTGGNVTWHLGFEIIGNHDPQWCLEPAWAVADWGLHVAGQIGPECAPPWPDTPLRMTVTLNGAASEMSACWKVTLQTVLDVLERDCERVARPWSAGDLVWTGALAPPIAVDATTTLSVDIDGYGTATLARH
jgi:2-keto-4-pentenoate hydratase